MGRRNEQGMTIQCNHCGYRWLTQSERAVVSCPYCGWRVRLRRTRPGEINPTPGNISSGPRRLI